MPVQGLLECARKIWIQKYFGPVTVDSVEIFPHFAFWRHGSTLANFVIAPKNCIFWGASFELIKILATLVPKNLQCFYETLLYHSEVTPYSTCSCLLFFNYDWRTAASTLVDFVITASFFMHRRDPPPIHPPTQHSYMQPPSTTHSHTPHGIWANLIILFRNIPLRVVSTPA